MKLHELGGQRPINQTSQLLENQVGKSFDFGQVGPRRARGMLDQVQRLIQEHRRTPEFHVSQNDPAYMQLVIMEQALTARLSEELPSTNTTSATTADPAMNSAAAKDPKARAIMDKVKRGQTLTPDEQKTVNLLALSKESKQPGRMVREASELQQAQVVLAAQDMIDRLQGMMEDISEMQFKDLPALTDSIKNDVGVDQASQFQSQTSAALTQLLQAVQTSKTELEGAQGVLTGQAPQIPGVNAGVVAPDDTGEVSADLDVDATIPVDDLDDQDNEDGDAADVPLGRDRR